MPLTQVYGFVGWALKNNPTRVLDISTIHPIMDYEFVAVYEEKSVYDNVLSSSYLTVVNSGSGCEISVASGVKLSGKITLPANINGKDVIAIRNNGFLNQSDITHIFWSNGTENKVAKIGEAAFNQCIKLVYYEMSNSVTSINIGNASFRYTRILENLDEYQMKQFFEKVTAIQRNAFSMDYDIVSPLTTLYLPSGLKTLEDVAFVNYRNLSQVIIGSSGNPIQLTSIGQGPFNGSGINVD